MFNLYATAQVKHCHLTCFLFGGQYDIGLCAYVAMLRIVSRFHDEVFSDPNSPSGLNLVWSLFAPPSLILAHCGPFQQLDFLELTTTYDNYLDQFFNEWSSRFNNDSDLSGTYIRRPIFILSPDTIVRESVKI